MKWMLSVCVALSMGVALAADTDVKECSVLIDEKLTELKSLTVTEDVHDLLVGDVTEVWGPKPAIEKDENTCIKSTRTKLNDKELANTAYLKGEWFGGEKTKNGTLEKVENGVYLLKKHSGQVKGKVYILYADNHVVAFYACSLCKGHGSSDETKKPEEKKPEEKKHGEMKKNKLPFWSTISIRAEDLKTPRDEEVQKSVKEAVDMIQAHKELLGEIVEYPHPC